MMLWQDWTEQLEHSCSHLIVQTENNDKLTNCSIQQWGISAQSPISSHKSHQNTFVRHFYSMHCVREEMSPTNDKHFVPSFAVVAWKKKVNDNTQQFLRRGGQEQTRTEQKYKYRTFEKRSKQASLQSRTKKSDACGGKHRKWSTTQHHTRALWLNNDKLFDARQFLLAGLHEAGPSQRARENMKESREYNR